MDSGRKGSSTLTPSSLKSKEDKSNDALISSRSSISNTARSSVSSARYDGMESTRSTMSTSRVQTALAALAAEKDSLQTQLSQIDAALETENRRVMSKPRTKK
mmetsp:Transcript_5240/g.5370  ORF Transcript_5240/g.5370 Transcript_5240/m.5370 type:complete len:103 (+) Transcript_5240:184-492(+)